MMDWLFGWFRKKPIPYSNRDDEYVRFYLSQLEQQAAVDAAAFLAVYDNGIDLSNLDLNAMFAEMDAQKNDPGRLAYDRRCGF